jgi:hypothetical protein
MSSFFDDLEAQLSSAARARAGASAPAGGDAPRRRRRRRGWLRAAPVLAAVVIALVVVGGALVLLGHRGNGGASGSRPPGGSIGALIAHTPKRQLHQELRYVFAATQSVQSSKACQLQQPSGVTYVQGSPGPDLLSILGVLRRPANPADRLNARGVGSIPDVYRAYIRRALSAGRVSYYIVPGRFDRAAASPPERCFELLAAALNRYLPRIPAASRRPTHEIGAAYIAYLRTIASQAPQDAIYLVDVPGDGHGSPDQMTPKGIEDGFATENFLGTPVGTFSGVVPDGVATVTLALPAIGRQPAHAVTTRVEGNVYAVRVSGLSRSQVSPTVIWRSPEGRVLKRMSTSDAANRAFICKQSPVGCLLAQALEGSSTSSGSSPVRSTPARGPGG